VQLRRRSDSWQEILPPFPPNPPGRSRGPDHLLGILHLLDCIEGRCEPLLGFEQAAHVLQIIEAAQESAATGCAVAID
jgi:predicted dehydrogenase